MTGIIWGETLRSAKEQLNKIINNYKRMGQCKRACIRKDQARFDNGDMWVIKRANGPVPGLRANIAYIDTRIDPQFIDEVIRPSLTLLPYTAIRYYFPEEMNDIYDE